MQIQFIHFGTFRSVLSVCCKMYIYIHSQRFWGSSVFFFWPNVSRDVKYHTHARTHITLHSHLEYGLLSLEDEIKTENIRFGSKVNKLESMFILNGHTKLGPYILYTKLFAKCGVFSWPTSTTDGSEDFQQLFALRKCVNAWWNSNTFQIRAKLQGAQRLRGIECERDGEVYWRRRKKQAKEWERRMKERK